MSNITQQEFRIIVIRLIAGLEKGIEDSKVSVTAEIKELKNSHDELKNAINEVQNKLEVATELKRQRGEQGKQKIKLWEKMKLRKRQKKFRSMRGEL